MSHHHSHKMSRRDFLKIGGLAMGGASLACTGGGKLAELTAVPPVTLTPLPVPTLAAGEFANTIFVNGNIITIDPKCTISKALAIKNGVILAVEADQSIRNMAGESSKVIDLRGRTMTPGFIDAHYHLSACGHLGTAFVDVNWPGVFTIEDMQAHLAEMIAVTPAGEWVIGAGWVTFERRYPNKHDLDPVSPNHPVFVTNQGGHMAVVNSLALEMAGVNAKTKDPGNGRFLREANDEPDGTIINHPTMDIFRKLWPPEILNLAVMETSVLNPQPFFAQLGVTSFQDVYARDMDRVQAYFNVARRGEMSIRGQIMNVLEYIQELDGRIEDIEAMHYEDDYMHFAGAKFQIDGAFEASYTSEPHSGMAYNITIWKPRDLNDAVRAFHDAGYQVALHTIGDAAVDMALDAIEQAMKANPRSNPRHRLEHSVLNSEEAFQRTKDLGVVISTQPQVIRAFGDAAARIWGENRMNRMIPTRTWLDMGVPLCLSSDAPSLPWWSPWVTNYSCIERISWSKKPVSPEQSISLDEAMYAHTMAGAYADFAENKKGSLEPGKFADLVVWQDNPYTVATEDLLNLKADMTLVGGKVVYDAEQTETE